MLKWSSSIAVLLAAAVVSGVSAQERIEVLSSRGADGLVMGEVDVSEGGFGRVYNATPLPTPPAPATAPGRPIALSGGRYLAWINTGFGGSTSRTVWVFDRRTRQAFRVNQFPGSVTSLVPDPLLPRLFFRDASRHEVSMVDARTVAFRVVATNARMFAYAADVDQVVVARPGLGGGWLAVFVDVATAAEVRTIPLAQEPRENGFLVSRNGQRLWVYGAPADDTSGAAHVAVYDALTGQVIAQAEAMRFTDPLQLDERRNILLAPWNFEGRVAVLNADTLVTTGIVRVDGHPNEGSGTRVFQLLQGRGAVGAYVVRREYRAGSPGCARFDLDALDVQGQRRRTLDLRGPLGASCSAIGGGALVRTPFAPARLSAQVSGRDVTLTWQNPGDATGFAIIAGLAPGGTILTQRLPLTTMVVFADVPPGTYYVRVRAFNELGAGAVSTDVRVDVP